MSPSRVLRHGSWWIGAAVGLAVLVLSVRAQPLSPEGIGDRGAPVNVMCPVMPDEPIDPRFTAEYNGKTVGLCCRKCLTKFRADPDRYIADIPELQPTASDVPEDPRTAIDHADEHAQAKQPTAQGDAGHDHADHESFPRWITWIGKLHPPATHLPIGLLIGAIIAELGVIATGKDAFRNAAGFCVVVAALSAVVAAALGWFNGGWVLWDEDWTQAAHRWLGTATAGLTLLTLAALIRAHRPTPPTHAVRRFRVLLFLSGGLVAATGFFGGALVYGIDHYAW